MGQLQPGTLQVDRDTNNLSGYEIYLLKEEKEFVFPSVSSIKRLQQILADVDLLGIRDLHTHVSGPSMAPRECGMPQAAAACTTIWNSQDFYVETIKSFKYSSTALPWKPFLVTNCWRNSGLKAARHAMKPIFLAGCPA